MAQVVGFHHVAIHLSSFSRYSLRCGPFRRSAESKIYLHDPERHARCVPHTLNLHTYPDSWTYLTNPGHHAQFMRDLALLPSIRSYVIAHGPYHRLAEAYNDTLVALQEFRTAQMKIAAAFISKIFVVPKTGPDQPPPRPRSGVALPSTKRRWRVGSSLANIPWIAGLGSLLGTSHKLIKPQSPEKGTTLTDNMRNITLNEGSSSPLKRITSTSSGNRSSSDHFDLEMSESEWVETVGKELAAFLMGMRSDTQQAMIQLM